MKINFHTKLQLVKIYWRDHSSDSSWASLKDIEKTAEVDYLLSCESVGWIIKETKKYIIIAASRNFNGEFAERTTIIKSCIIKREKI